MASTHLDLGEELGALMAEFGQPFERAAREMIVLELYRRSLITSGKAASLLGIPRLDFIQRASELGIPPSLKLAGSKFFISFIPTLLSRLRSPGWHQQDRSCPAGFRFIR
jgi:Uncharacterised protein family (UPF0175)